MLEYDKTKRATAIECLNHSWIKEAKTFTPTSKNLANKSGERNNSIKLRMPISPSFNEGEKSRDYYDLEDKKIISSSKLTRITTNEEVGEVDILKEEF
jgi:hypothetical protein